MMQVSTLYAHSLERQFISKRSQLLQNISRSCSIEQQQQGTPPMQEGVQEAAGRASLHLSLENLKKNQSDDKMLSEAGIIPPELADTYNVCPPVVIKSEVDPKEFTDRLCKLPSQCRGGHILGAPRRHSIGGPAVGIASRMCQSTGNLGVSSNLSLVKSQHRSNKSAIDSKVLLNNNNNNVVDKKSDKKKDKKGAKKTPSNFMFLGTWCMKINSDKMLAQVKSGDVLEFNITLHHHWGIAIVHKNKKPSLETIEIIHLFKEDNGRQRVIKQTLAEYWSPGVTARINNSKDIDKQPLPALDVASTALKLINQPYKIWENSGQMITYCRYGEGQKARQDSDSARWASLSKCVGLWLNLTSSRQNSPTGSPTRRRKRTLSVNF